MTQHPKLSAFNFHKWAEDNVDKLRPPVGNQLLHKEGDMIVMVVGGPEGIVTELPKIYEAFHQSTEARTCPQCGTLHPGKGKPPADWVQL